MKIKKVLLGLLTLILAMVFGVWIAESYAKPSCSGFIYKANGGKKIKMDGDSFSYFYEENDLRETPVTLSFITGNATIFTEDGQRFCIPEGVVVQIEN